MDEPNALIFPDPHPPIADGERLQPAPDHAEESLAEVVDDAVPARSYRMLPMVGLGGSAGAIAALQAFFAAVPADSGRSTSSSRTCRPITRARSLRSSSARPRCP